MDYYIWEKNERSMVVCGRVDGGDFAVWYGLSSAHALASFDVIQRAAFDAWGGSWVGVVARSSFELWCKAPVSIVRQFHCAEHGYRSRGALIVRPRCTQCDRVIAQVCTDACRLGAPCLLESGHERVPTDDAHFAAPWCRECLRGVLSANAPLD